MSRGRTIDSAMGSVSGSNALPCPVGDAAALRGAAVRLRRAEHAARETPTLRGRLTHVLPRVWAGAAAEAAVAESTELVRRCSTALAHLSFAAAALERYAAALEDAQLAVRRLQRRWDAAAAEHDHTVALVRLRSVADIDSARLLVRLHEEHEAVRAGLSRQQLALDEGLAAAALRAARTLAALDDVTLPRRLEPSAEAVQRRLVDALPIAEGAATAVHLRRLAVTDAAGLRSLTQGRVGPAEVEALVRSLGRHEGDPVYAQALLDEVGIDGVNQLVAELLDAGGSVDVDLTRQAVGALGILVLTATAPSPSSARDPLTSRRVESAAALLRDDLVESLGQVRVAASGRSSSAGHWILGQLVVGARASGWAAPMPPALVRRLASGAAAAEIAETRDDDAFLVHSTTLPPSGNARFASLFDEADVTGDSLHAFLSEAGRDPEGAAALLSTPVDGHGLTDSRGGRLVLAEALVRRWITYEAAGTTSHADLRLATNDDLMALLSTATSVDSEQSAALRARVMAEIGRTNSFAQESFPTVAIYEGNTARLEAAAAQWVIGMPEAVDALLARPGSDVARAWIRAVGSRPQPLLRLDELTGLVGAFAIGTDTSGSAKTPDATYQRLVDGELSRARRDAADGGRVDDVAVRLGFYEQAASAALVAVARRQDAANQSMWRTLAEAKALALAWKQGPFSLVAAAGTVLRGDSNRTAADDLAIAHLRSNVELAQTTADEGRSRSLAAALDSIGVGVASTSAASLMQTGARRGPVLPTSDEVVAARRTEQAGALDLAVRELAEDNTTANQEVGDRAHAPTETFVVPKRREPEPHELYTAERLRRVGYDVEFLPRSDTTKMPDAVIAGERWEFKAPIGSSPGTVTQLLREARRQSSRIIVDLARCPLRLDEVLLQVDSAIRRYDGIDVVILITRDGDVIERRP